MNKPKQSLRSTLAALAEEFAEAVIAAAREALFEVAAVTAPQTRRERVRRGAPAAPAAPATSQLVLTALTDPDRTARTPPTRRATTMKAPVQPVAQPARAKRTRAAHVAAEHGPSDQLITDPQLLLAALDTAAPALGYDEPAPRKEPEILRSVSGDTTRQSSAPDRGGTSANIPDRATAFAPVLREGEVIVRRSAGGVVLRRRRG